MFQFFSKIIVSIRTKGGFNDNYFEYEINRGTNKNLSLNGYKIQQYFKELLNYFIDSEEMLKLQTTYKIMFTL